MFQFSLTHTHAHSGCFHANILQVWLAAAQGERTDARVIASQLETGRIVCVCLLFQSNCASLSSFVCSFCFHTVHLCGYNTMWICLFMNEVRQASISIFTVAIFNSQGVLRVPTKAFICCNTFNCQNSLSKCTQVDCG